MTALIAMTGGRGFIGRHAVNRLMQAGYDVRLSGRGPTSTLMAPSIPLDLCDLTERSLSALLDGSSALVHLAGVLSDEQLMHAVHVEGTERLVKAAFERGIPVVHLSSCGVYGPRNAGIISERDSFNPVGPYELTKAEGELRVSATAAAFNGRAIVLRPSIVYGRDMPNESIRALVRTVATERFVYIGPPGATYNLVHVDDIATAIVLAVAALRNDVATSGCAPYNLSDCYSFDHLIPEVAAQLGIPSPRWRIPAAPMRLIGRLGDRIGSFPLTTSRVQALSGRARYDCSAALHHLGWQPRVSMRDGIAELIGAMTHGRH